MLFSRQAKQAGKEPAAQAGTHSGDQPADKGGKQPGRLGSRIGRKKTVTLTEIQSKLLELADPKYKEFHQGLVPTLNPDKIIGVRTPAVRTLAKQMRKDALNDPQAAKKLNAFLQDLPHEYYDENQLHAMIVAEEKDFDLALRQVEAFLPYIDNWATCDQLSPKAFRKKPDELLPHIYSWIDSGETYMIRFGVVTLMNNYLGDNFLPGQMEKVAAIRSDEYYVKMAVAWYFATALGKRFDIARNYIEKRRLDPWTHNKTIAKCMDSDRVVEEHKNYLRMLRLPKSEAGEDS